jgi:hypothetical protein
MSIHHNENTVAYAFRENYIGEVKRVDFVPLETPNSDRFCSAFVHCYHANPSFIQFIDELEGPSGYRLQIDANEYWIMLKNKNPISDTRLNIHQVVENARLLEQRVVEQNAFIEAQTEQIFRIHETVYRMMTSLYSQDEDKKRMFGHYNYMVYGEYFDDRILSEDDFEYYDENFEYCDETEEKKQRKIEKAVDRSQAKERNKVSL